MNCFEMDLKRAIASKGFLLGVILEIIIAMKADISSRLFQMSFPVLCTLPYGTAWMTEYESGFVKLALVRSQKNAYILGKIAASAISGGLLQVMVAFALQLTAGESGKTVDAMLFFMSGMLWALAAALLAAYSQSYYLAYGGGFVIYYFLIILHERYLKALYCLSPWEWLKPEHSWIFETTGVLLLVGTLCALVSLAYYSVLRRCLENV